MCGSGEGSNDFLEKNQPLKTHKLIIYTKCLSGAKTFVLEDSMVNFVNIMWFDWLMLNIGV